MTDATILVIEDHPATRKLVRITLAGAGYTVLEADSGSRAIELAGESPDLVLLDLHLPDMSGFEVAERIRGRDGTTPCPILAFSGFLPAMEDGRIAAAGLAGFITKPVEPSRLLEIVRLHLPPPTFGGGAAGTRRVLVVEDDPIQRKLLSARLSRLGYDVREAADGDSALDVLGQVAVDVVLSDVLMPRRDGFELALAIRTDPRLAHIPVVLLSSHAQEAADQRMAEVVGAHTLIQRQAGYEGIEVVLEESIRQGPRPCAPASVDELRTDYLHRVIRQLERQGAFNAHLAQQSSIQAAQLDILAGFAEVLTRTLDADVLLDETLRRMLETLRFARGAAYLLEDGVLSLRARRGLDAVSTSTLEDLFGQAALMQEALATREPLFVPVDDPRGAAICSAAPELWAGHGSFIIMPFNSGQEVLGLFVIGCARLQVGNEWRPFALAIGAQVGQALAVVRALGELAESERLAQRILDSLSEGVTLVNREEVVESANASARLLFGHGRAAPAAVPLREFASELRQQDGEPLAYDHIATVRALRTGEPQSLVCVMDRTDGERPLWLAVKSTPLLKPGDAEPYAAVTSYTDITEQRLLEEQFRQAQKMEAVGRLAGGIAHDFNNLLMVVSTLSDLWLSSVAPDSALAADFEEIRAAAEKASMLTHQLLAFSRSRDVELRRIDVNSVVRDMERMLRRLMPREVAIVVQPDTHPLPVRANVGQMEQVVVNLVVNARDAMPHGGTVRISTAIVELLGHPADRAGVVPGSYVQLIVQDTGVGVSESVRARIFEPFFTTKGPDGGTGLGLATVYGIVQQFGGAITLDSTPGHGARFTVLLPSDAGEDPDRGDAVDREPDGVAPSGG